MSEQCYDFSGSNLGTIAQAQSAMRIIFDGILGNLRGTNPVCSKLSAIQPQETSGVNSRQNPLDRALSDLVEKRGRATPYK